MIHLLLKQTREYRVQYIFTPFGPELERDTKFLISCFKQDSVEFESLLYDWFKEGKNNPDKFIASHGNNDITLESEIEFSNHRSWSTSNALKATPTILVYGFLLPKGISVSDLAYTC